MELDTRFFKNLLDNLNVGVYFVDPERRVYYWNRASEKITGFNGQEVLGKRCSDNILVHVDSSGKNLCQGMCPLARAVAEGQSCSLEAWLRHKEGHRIPVSIQIAPLYDDTGGVLGAVEIFWDNSEKLSTLEQIRMLKRENLEDHLTNIGNRRSTEMVLRNHLNSLAYHGWDFGVLFLDIDNFKQINDHWGHNVGDQVLKMVATTLLGALRSFDFVGRWGGEEFLVLLPHISKSEALARTAERFRAMIESSMVPLDGQQLKVTACIGGTLARREDSLESLVERADQMMYTCKQSGRNRVNVG